MLGKGHPVGLQHRWQPGLFCWSVVLHCGKDFNAWYIDHDVLICLCRLLQRPATVPGGRGIGSEARAANEMRILGMNQPFPAIFGGEDVRVHLLRPLALLMHPSCSAPCSFCARTGTPGIERRLACQSTCPRPHWMMLHHYGARLPVRESTG